MTDVFVGSFSTRFNRMVLPTLMCPPRVVGRQFNQIRASRLSGTFHVTLMWGRNTGRVTAERLLRFTRTERAAHWLLVATLAAILLSGTQMPHHGDADQPVVDIHVGGALLLVAGLTLLLWRADRHALVATAVSSRRPSRRPRVAPGRARPAADRSAPPPVGRFNAGQKLNARLSTLALAVLYATGRRCSSSAAACRRAAAHADHSGALRARLRARVHGRLQPGHPARAARDDARGGRPGVGGAPPPQVGGARPRGYGAPSDLP